MFNKDSSFELYKNTFNFAYDAKLRSGSENNFFIPIGIFLLKWVSDSKDKLSLIGDFDYKSDTNCSKNIKKNLILVSKAIEDNNSFLKGIFTQLCFSDIEYIHENYLNEMVIFYSEIDFNIDENLTRDFMHYFLVGLYDMVDEFSFMSPPSIANLLSRLFDINENMNILDIACGTGSVLSTILYEYKQNLDTINLYGQDINVKAVLLCKINLLLHGVKLPKIKIKDSLAEPIVFEDNSKMDIVLSNLPLGQKLNANQIGYKNEFKSDISSFVYADWLFIQRGIATLKDDGKAAFIVSSGTLSRVNEIKTREMLLTEDIIEAVIALPTNLNKGSNINLEILIINKNKSKVLKRKILFIDASEEFFQINNSLNELEINNIKNIVKMYKDYSNKDIEIIDKVAIASFEEIAKNSFSLVGSQYKEHRLNLNKKHNMICLQDISTVKRGLQVTRADFIRLINSNDVKSKLNQDIFLEKLPFYIKIGDLNNDTIEFNDRVDNLSNKQIDAYMLKTNDILISARGTLIKTAVYEESMPSCVFSGNIILIRPKPNKYNSHFLKFYLDSNEGKAIISRMQSGSTIISLNPNVLKKLKVPNISYDEQNKIAERIIENEKTYKERIEKAKSIYKQNVKSINDELRYLIEY